MPRKEAYSCLNPSIKEKEKKCGHSLSGMEFFYPYNNNNNLNFMCPQTAHGLLCGTQHIRGGGYSHCLKPGSENCGSGTIKKNVFIVTM